MYARVKTGRYAQAVPLLEALHRAHPDDPGIQLLLARVLGRIGPQGEPRGRKLALGLAASVPAGHRAVLPLARLLVRLNEVVAAEGLLGAQPQDAEVLSQTAEVLRRLGRQPEALSRLAEAVALTPEDGERRARLVAQALGLGDPALAAQVLTPVDPPLLQAQVAAAARDGAGVGAVLARARASADFAPAAWIEPCLHVGRVADAQALALEAQDTDWLATFARWAEPRPALLETAVPGDESLILHAEWLLGEERWDDAHAAAHRGRQLARRFPIPGACVYLVASLATDTRHKRMADPPDAVAELRPCLEAVFGDDAARVMAPDARCLTVLRLALERFGGNRSPWPVLRAADGTLEAYEGPIPPRAQGRALQMLLRTRPVDQVVAAFQGLGERYPTSSVVRTYQGEVHLWVGALDDAAACFRRALALDRRTKWAWIGLGAIAYLGGDSDAALSTWAEGEALVGAGPTLYAYRGEALRRRGELEAAAAELEQALNTSPRRLGTRVNLALLAHAEGRPEDAERLAAALPRAAPGFLEDLEVVPEGAAARLEALLDAMRGNRSSAMPCWVDLVGRLRFLNP